MAPKSQNDTFRAFKIPSSTVSAWGISGLSSMGERMSSVVPAPILEMIISETKWRLHLAQSDILNCVFRVARPPAVIHYEIMTWDLHIKDDITHTKTALTKCDGVKVIRGGLDGVGGQDSLFVGRGKGRQWAERKIEQLIWIGYVRAKDFPLFHIWLACK